MVKLRRVTVDNFDDVMRLQLAPEHRDFVAPNMASLAEERFRSHLESHAIYADDQLVGYVLHGTWDGPAHIFRIMVDQRFQRRGYGTAAIEHLCTLYGQIYGYDALSLGVNPDNPDARKLYLSLGFAETDRFHFGDPVLTKAL